MVDSTTTIKGVNPDNDLAMQKKRLEAELAQYEDGTASFASALESLELFVAECSSLTSNLGVGPDEEAARVRGHRQQFDDASRKLQGLLKESLLACRKKAEALEQELIAAASPQAKR